MFNITRKLVNKMYSFTRGDSFLFKTGLTTIDKKPINIEDISTIFVTCRKETTKESKIIFQKTLDDVIIDNDGYCHVVFEPKDTENLLCDKYYFDIEVTLKSGYRKTKLSSFTLTEETTTHGGEENGI